MAKEQGRITVKMVPLRELKAYERNARTHSKKQIDLIAKSLDQFGWMVPVLVDDENTIIAGHARVQAAEKLGLAKAACIRVSHLSESQKRAYILADNKLAEMSGWDGSLLGLELKELKLEGADLKALGFGPADLKKYGASDPADEAEDADASEDDPVMVPADPVSAAGDLWLLGKHRVICGDATDPAVTKRLLADGLAPNLMVTDPPYGVDYDPKWREMKLPNASENRATGLVVNDLRPGWFVVYSGFAGSVAYVWHSDKASDLVKADLEDAGFEIRAQIIWRKSRFTVSRGHYHWQHEPLWYAVRKGGTARWQGDRKQSTVWDIASASGAAGNNKGDNAATGHGTQKPIECMLRPILNHTQEGEAVFDPFLGSGTTLIAAERSGRVCYGVELNPAYVDVIVERWQRATGERAVLADSGEDLDALRAARKVKAA